MSITVEFSIDTIFIFINDKRYKIGYLFDMWHLYSKPDQDKLYFKSFYSLLQHLKKINEN
jgi:hypothetical protein